MEKASVSRIFIEYKDGSYDTIEPIQEDPTLFLYGLERNNASGDRIIDGAHTNAAIAALLFVTAINAKHIDYNLSDPQIFKLLKYWNDNIRQN